MGPARPGSRETAGPVVLHVVDGSRPVQKAVGPWPDARTARPCGGRRFRVAATVTTARTAQPALLERALGLAGGRARW